MERRVVLAMSGGVDSSVAAYLLKEQGYEVIGLFMRTGAHTETPERRAKTCCSVSDALDARAVADRLDIPFYVLDFEREFGRIMDDFADEYLAGRTPNPCVLCNVWLKFGKLWAYGRQVGAQFVATGHYAQIRPDAAGQPRVARAADPEKDQSYVLSGIRKELLPQILLPVGGYRKADIRGLARGRAAGSRQAGQPGDLLHPRRRLPGVRAAPPARRRDLGANGGHRRHRARAAFGHRGVHDRPAPRSGHSRHGGAQVRRRDRAGPADGGCRPARGPRKNRPGSLPVQLARAGPRGAGFLSGPDPPPSSARAGDRRTATRARARVHFETPQPAVAPGQIVAVYQDGWILGGGWIDRAIDGPQNSGCQ